jgi:hypothetical protein
MNWLLAPEAGAGTVEEFNERILERRNRIKGLFKTWEGLANEIQTSLEPLGIENVPGVPS